MNFVDHSILIVLCDAAMKSAMLLLAAWIATLFMRRASAAARHLIWVAAMGMSLLLPVGSVLLPQYRIPILPAESRLVIAPVFPVVAPFHLPPPPHWGMEANPVPTRPLPLVRGEPSERDLPFADVLPRPEHTTPPPPPSLPASHPMDSAATVQIIWLGGAAIFMAYWFLGVLLAWRLTRNSNRACNENILLATQNAQKNLHVRRVVDLRIGSHIRMPMTWGLLRPRLLLPDAAESWSKEQLASVLPHELAHVKRLDCGTQWLSQWMCALYWFNPLAWFSAARLRLERERACDDLVLAHGSSAANYATHLVAVAQSLRGRSFLQVGAVGMARPSGLRRRVMDILDKRINRGALTRRLALGAMAIAVALLVPLSSLHLGMRHAAMAQTTQPSASTNDDANAPSPAPSNSKFMQLTVLDRTTGNPLPGVKVDVASEPKDIHLTTDANGQVWVDFSRSSYDECNLTEAHHVGEALEWNRQRNGDMPPAAFTVRMAAGTRIGGKIVDEQGRPIVGAHVVESVQGNKLPDPHERVWVQYNDTLTAADGTWHFDFMPADFQSISIGVWDYQYVISDGGFGFFDMTAYHDPASLRNGSATIILHHGVIIEGVVLDPNGNSIKGARVGVGPDRVASNSIPALRTGSDGRFAFAFKPETHVVLTAFAKGDAPELVETIATANSPDVVFHMTPGRHLEGRVVDADGKPLANTYVWIDTWRGYRTFGGKTLRTDAQGRFHWNEAPADTVYADVQSTDSRWMRSNRVPLTAGADNTVTLQGGLTVSGTVIDAVTGKPIPEFRLIHGSSFDADRPAYFGLNSSELDTVHGGTFTYQASFPYPFYALRVEANGYLPVETRLFTAAEHNVHFDLKMQPCADWREKVLLPNGQPAAGVTATLILPGENPFQYDAQLYPSFPDQQHQHFTTDANGVLDITPQGTLAKIVILSPNGYAEADQDLLKKNATIQLQPWAHIQGRLLVGGKPAAGQKVTASRQDLIAFDPSVPSILCFLNTTTDGEGRFSFNYVPSEVNSVSRTIEQGNGVSYWSRDTDTQSVTLQPGQTVQVALGGSGRKVVGRVLNPAQLAGRSDWSWYMDCQIMGSASFPQFPMPADVKNGSAERQRQWAMAFLKTDAGKQYEAQMKIARQTQHVYPLEMQPDGSFIAEDVAPGTYSLSIGIAQRPAAATGCMTDEIASGGETITVPDDGRMDQPVVVAPVPMSMLVHIDVGQVVPDFSATTLEGKPLKLSDFRGKFVLLDFWATWCGPCRQETPSIKAAFDAYGKDDRFAMISVSLDRKAEDAKTYVQQNQLNWNQVFVPNEWDSATVKSFGVDSIPSVWLIGPDGKVIARDLRGDAIKAAIGAALSSAS